MVNIVYIIKENEQNLSSHLEEFKTYDMVFRKVAKDTVGLSSSNPTWGYAYKVKNGKMKFVGEGLYKEYDFDCPHAAYSEKLASIMGSKILKNTRVPKVDIVEPTKDEPGIISHKILNNYQEDMFHLRDMMFHIFEREELASQKGIFNLEDILKAVRAQIKDDENYKVVEISLIRAMLFDSVVNNGDRHTNNWALVRNKETNWYELAVFDHASTFIDMIKEQRMAVADGWTSSYISVKEQKGGIRKGSLGRDIIQYIAHNYNEYYNEFCDDFETMLPEFIEEIKAEKLPVDMGRLENKLNERKQFLKRVRSKEEELAHGE